MSDSVNSNFPDLQAQKKRTRRLQFILLAVAALLTAGIILISVNSYKNYETETLLQLEQQLSSIGALKSSELALWYRERTGDAEMLKNSPALPPLLGALTRDYAGADDLRKLQLYLETLTVSYGYESYLITDARGKAFLSFPEGAELEPVNEHMAEIEEAFAKGQVIFIDFHTHEEHAPERIFLSFVIPLFEEDSPGEPLGAIIITINPEDYLYPLVSAWPVPRKTAETLLIRPENGQALYLNPLRFSADAALNLQVSLAAKEILAVQAVMGQTGIVEGTDYRGRQVIGSLNQVDGTPWYMVSKIDADEFFTPIRQRRERAVFTTTALLFISFAVLIIIWRSQQLRYLKTVGSINTELERRVEERTAQLEAANKELEAFAYSVSHDLRAPLRAMSGFSEFLLEDYSPLLDEKGKHYIERIQAASNRMGELIDDLLILSRATRSELTFEQVDISKLASGILSGLKETEPERPVQAEVEAGLTVRGDQKLLSLALENLLSNAWKFSSLQPQAKIEVGSTNEGHNKSFFIRDNGVGFDMAYSDKLHIPFQRLHRTDEFPGTGIGLSIVSRIIERHGGELWAESEVDKGATFYFTLPGQ